jgi:hypothetical protein
MARISLAIACFAVSWLLGGVSSPQAPAQGEAPGNPTVSDKVSPEGAAFFERKIRPVLVAECYGCHASTKGEKPRGGLALDTWAGTRQGGDSGPPFVSGDPAASLILQALRHDDPEFAMPPKKKLSDAIVRDFAEWIRLGAPDPRQDAPADRREPDLEQGRRHWAFQPPRQVAPPQVKASDWPRTEVDRYILSSLEAQGLKPVADADPRTLLRRLALDLTGLPPTPAEVEAFAAAPTPAALAQTVDRLLASPQFGEKWARHWLDVARYAESTGKTVNFNYPHAWRYRDYVIDAFNSDKPYDQFIQEQLAGDWMPTDDPRARAERIIATGFLAIGPKTLNERSGLQFELDIVDEQIDVTTQAFLGMTIACARCHDHKFDPISQADYYALAGIFRSTETCYGTVTFINARRPTPLLPLPSEADPVAPPHRLTEAERRRIENQLASVRESVSAMRDPIQRFLASEQLSLLQARLDGYNADGHPHLLAMGVRDKPSGREFTRPRDRFAGPGGYSFNGSRAIADSPLYERGEVDQPSAERIPRGAPRVLCAEPLRIPASTSGRRELAAWIASPENPLTARVMVNRVWLQLFGRGLVPTADDFGLAGRPPSHPELLDHLALRFVEDGWSVKRLIKHLVLSRVYQLDAQASAAAREIDPENTWLWRMTPRRLDAEILRDAILAASGQLALTPPVGSAVARAGEGPVMRPRLGGDSVTAALNDSRNTHRSVYLPIVRDNLPEALALFDGADPALITADRPQTTVPTQGLYLLNSAFLMRAADATADRLLELSDPADRIREAFLRCYSRPPTAQEQAAALVFLEGYRREATRNRAFGAAREREAWSAFCQALFASAEFQYRK